MKLTIFKQVGVDGRLLPATDDELMEVEHLLEDDGTQLQPVEVRRQSEWLLLKTTNLEGMGVKFILRVYTHTYAYTHTCS